ncbi:hypothetical protein QTV49_001828 [Vibrio vulnificus]|nr:hypothetical protein [Vibrio vulnificus]
MIELIVVGSLMASASVFVLSQYITNRDYKAGAKEATLANELLNEALMLHPANSMIKPFLYPLSSSQEDDRNDAIIREGFDSIPSTDLKIILNKYFKGEINAHKKAITFTPNGQFLGLNTEVTSKDTCSGLISDIRSTSWQQITINGATVQIQGAKAQELANLCSDNATETYSYSLQYCYETAALPCT